MNILDEITANKKLEVEKAKSLRSLEDLERDPRFDNKKNSLVQRLKAGGTGIIAEFKRKSPSKGWFKPKEFAIKTVVKDYSRYGADGLSVLTDENFFGGRLADLVEAKENSDLPVLRKDFIIDPWQLAEAKYYGADVVLLIAACLTVEKTRELAVHAKNTGLEILLEIHNEKELDHICDEVDMVGVNNRDLETFEVNLEISFRLIEKIKGRPAIAESGINDVETIRRLSQAGFKGFLIGERFMKENDPGKAFKDFSNKLKFSSPLGGGGEGAI